MMKMGDKRLALRLASSWSGYSTRRGLGNLSAASVGISSNQSNQSSLSATRLPQVNWIGGGGCVSKGSTLHSSPFSASIRQLSISAAAWAPPLTEGVKEAATAEPANATATETAAAAAATSPSSPPLPPTDEVAAAAFVLPDKPVPSVSGLSMEYTPGTDPPLEAVGLGNWTPAGRVQVLLDYLHNGVDIPWCGTILITTIAMRLTIFPLVVWAQKNMALLHNNNHEISRLQAKMTDARQRGDVLETAQAGAKLQAFMKEKGINPLMNAVPILGQLPFFMSMFFGLRGLANLPMETMETGGLGWFSDLTIPDPYYGLSLALASTTFIQLKIGADGMKMDSMGTKKTAPFLKVAMYGIPCILFPATMNFASAVTFYWCCNNLISLVQAQIIKAPKMRALLGIPQMNRKPVAVPIGPDGKKQSFTQSLKDSMSNFKAQAEIIDRRAHDERVFREIGTSKPKRTFKFDPSKSKLK